QDWTGWLESVQDKRDVWEANWRRAVVQPAEAARLDDLPGPRRVLVLTEDWCGDAARSVPVIAKALDAAPQVTVRYLSLDEQPDAVLPYLTHGGRSIPIAIVLDEHGHELGAWGPRPAPLQALFRERRRELGAPDQGGMAAFYAPIMAWYAKDAGLTTLQELLMLLERGGTPR
ncbi:MAG: thioredoxin family protein, partial [Planctomycetota bacterium]